MRPHVSPQSQQLDDHLDGEDHGEDQVEDVHDMGEKLRLLVMLREKPERHQTLTTAAQKQAGGGGAETYLNGQSEGVSQNQHEHDVLKLTGVDDLPELQLGRVFRDVDLDRLSLQGVIDTLALREQRTVRLQSGTSVEPRR